MSSIDHRDAEVQNHFTTMKKVGEDFAKFRIAEQLAKMYEKNDDYTYGVYMNLFPLDIFPHVQIHIRIKR